MRWLALWLVAVSTVSAAAERTDYPNRPIRMVVPFAPGGFTDVVARLLAQRLTEMWGGRAIIVDNRSGAAGTIGPTIVVRAEPDGYTWLFGSNSTYSVNPAVYKSLPYDVARDLELIAITAFSPHVLLVRPGIAANNVQELVALAKKQPGKLTFASSGTGAVVHLAGELFKHRAGINIVHVPFKGGGPAATAMVGGEVDLMVNDAGPVLGHLKTGRLKVLAVASQKRSGVLPDVPTFAEAGVQGVESSSWAGIAVPAKTPADVSRAVSDGIAKAMSSPEYREKLVALGMEPIQMSRAETAAFIKQELAKWSQVAKTANVQIE